MKKIKLNKKIFFASIVATLSMPLFLSPLSLINKQDDQTFTSLNSLNSSTTKAVTANPNNVLLTPNNIINPKIDISSNISLNTTSQYRAEGYNGFALLTSSTTTNKFNQITKFNTSSSTAGTPDWIVKLTDLGKLISVSNESELKINSIIYSNGSLSEDSSLFVLVHSTNAANAGSYIFRINWNTNGSSIKGSYEMFQRLSRNASDVYNVLSITSLSKNSIIAFKLNQINSSADVVVSFKLATATQLITNTITINSSIASKLTITSKLVNSIYYNANLYLMFQAQSSATYASNNFTFVKIAPPTTSTPITVSSSNDIVSLDLSEFFPSIFADSTTNFLSSNLVDLKSGNYALFLSEKGTPATTKGKYVVSKFNLTSLFNGSELFINTSFLNYPSSGNYFIDAQPYYQNNTLSGYIVLDSSNKVSLLNLNFSYLRTLSNFSNSTSTSAIGNIFNIYTNVNSSNWYAQQTNGYFLEMFDSSIIGQWDKLLLSTAELPVIIDLKKDDDILDGTLYQKVANSANTDYSDTFKAFLNSPTAYQHFLSVIFVDPKLNGNLPKIDITYGSFKSSTNSIYEIELTFTQTLRTISANGSISGNGSTLILTKKIFTFINANVLITSMPEANIPIFLKNSYASSITQDQLLKYFLTISNVTNVKYSLNPDDLIGVLNVSLSIPYSWVDGVLKENQIFTVSFGSSVAPLFKINKLFLQDTSITLFTQDYLDANPQTLSILSNTYGASLASNVSKESFLKDFILFGTAFYDSSNESLITLPTVDNLVITPLDSKGTAYVEITIPKIGDEKNVFYSFETGSVFYKNLTANEPIYFSFNSNQIVLDHETTISGGIIATYSTFLPSQLAVNLNSIDKNQQLKELSIYAAYSPYFSTIIHQTSGTTPLMTLSAIPNDASGTLKISISLLNPLPTSNQNLIEHTFTGFKAQGNISATASTFKFNEIPGSLLARTPSSIKESELIQDAVIEITGTTANLERKIVLTPNNQQGLLEVKVIFYNWIESVSNSLTIVPVKEFLRIYSGFSQAKDPINTFVWKSFSELPKDDQTRTPESLITIVNQLANNYFKLEFFCNLSADAAAYLSSNPQNISLSLVPNNRNGTIEISAKLLGLTSSNSVDVISTLISGFNATSLNPGISWVNDSSDIINNLRSKLPSQLTYSEIGGLYSLINAGNYKANPTIIYDDITGLLTIKMALEPISSSSGFLPLTFSKTYTGFATNIPQYKATDWVLIFTLPIIIIAIFMIPIALLLINKYVLQRKKIAKKLDSRLDEEQNNNRKKKEIKSIKDLVDN